MVPDTTLDIFIFSCQRVESKTNSKLRQLSGRLQTSIWRPGETVQNVETPRLSGTVDSPATPTGLQFISYY